jgi:tetratricopeptide (TPR) repeat protein
VRLHLRLNLEASRRIGRGDYRAAADCYRAIAAADPEQWPALLMLAHCHECQGQHAEELAAAMRVVAAHPNEFLALQSMARACVNSGDHHTAKLYVDRALARVPPALSRREERYFLFCVRAIVAVMRLLPRYRRRLGLAQALKLSPTESHREWKAWAHEYLAWYAETFGESGPSVN